MRKYEVHLISPADSLPGGLLEAGDGLVEPVRLGLERLHLLPDRVHLEAGELCVSWRELSSKLTRTPLVWLSLLFRDAPLSIYDS